MNPSVKEDCTGLAVGKYYCGSTLSMGILADDEDDENPLSNTNIFTANPNHHAGGFVTPTPIQVCCCPWGATSLYMILIRQIGGNGIQLC